MWCSAAPQICTINNFLWLKILGLCLLRFTSEENVQFGLKIIMHIYKYFPFEIRYHFGVHFLFVFAILCLKNLEMGLTSLFSFSLSSLFSVSFLRIKNKWISNLISASLVHCQLVWCLELNEVLLRELIYEQVAGRFFFSAVWSRQNVIC